MFHLSFKMKEGKWGGTDRLSKQKKIKLTGKNDEK